MRGNITEGFRLEASGVRRQASGVRKENQNGTDLQVQSEFLLAKTINDDKLRLGGQYGRNVSRLEMLAEGF